MCFRSFQLLCSFLLVLTDDVNSQRIRHTNTITHNTNHYGHAAEHVYNGIGSQPRGRSVIRPGGDGAYVRPWPYQSNPARSFNNGNLEYSANVGNPRPNSVWPNGKQSWLNSGSATLSPLTSNGGFPTMGTAGSVMGFGSYGVSGMKSTLPGFPSTITGASKTSGFGQTGVITSKLGNEWANSWATKTSLPGAGNLGIPGSMQKTIGSSFIPGVNGNTPGMSSSSTAGGETMGKVPSGVASFGPYLPGSVSSFSTLGSGEAPPISNIPGLPTNFGSSSVYKRFSDPINLENEIKTETKSSEDMDDTSEELEDTIAMTGFQVANASSEETLEHTSDTPEWLHEAGDWRNNDTDDARQNVTAKLWLMQILLQKLLQQSIIKKFNQWQQHASQPLSDKNHFNFEPPHYRRLTSPYAKLQSITDIEPTNRKASFSEPYRSRSHPMHLHYSRPERNYWRQRGANLGPPSAISVIRAEPVTAGIPNDLNTTEYYNADGWSTTKTAGPVEMRPLKSNQNEYSIIKDVETAPYSSVAENTNDFQKTEDEDYNDNSVSVPPPQITDYMAIDPKVSPSQPMVSGALQIMAPEDINSTTTILSHSDLSENNMEEAIPNSGVDFSGHRHTRLSSDDISAINFEEPGKVVGSFQSKPTDKGDPKIITYKADGIFQFADNTGSLSGNSQENKPDVFKGAVLKQENSMFNVASTSGEESARIITDEDSITSFKTSAGAEPVDWVETQSDELNSTSKFRPNTDESNISQQKIIVGTALPIIDHVVVPSDNAAVPNMVMVTPESADKMIVPITNLATQLGTMGIMLGALKKNVDSLPPITTTATTTPATTTSKPTTTSTPTTHIDATSNAPPPEAHTDNATTTSKEPPAETHTDPTTAATTTTKEPDTTTPPPVVVVDPNVAGSIMGSVGSMLSSWIPRLSKDETEKAPMQIQKQVQITPVGSVIKSYPWQGWSDEGRRRRGMLSGSNRYTTNAPILDMLAGDDLGPDRVSGYEGTV